MRLLTAISGLAALFFTQCALPPTKTEVLRAESVTGEELFPTPVALNVPNESAALNDLARLLAGLPSLSGQDAFANIRGTPAWTEHSGRMNELFRQFHLRHGEPVTVWANAEMGNLRNSSTVFYPFSGPDFLFAHLFYPRAESYILCGLEASDPLPEWSTLSPEDINAGLEGLVTGMGTVLQYSYFITKDMRKDFQATRFRGVLPVFLVFMARTGHIVESINGVRLDANGNPVILPSAQTSVPGLLIRFRGPGGVSKRLFYFTQNLANDACKPNGPFLSFVSSTGRPAAMAKSASYLMHESYFSNIRNFLLTNTSGLVQDPSGVPYRSFAEKGWSVNLYGSYISTQSIFKEYEQPDLIAAYLNPGISKKPINFGIGYLTESSTTSLMLAKPAR